MTISSRVAPELRVSQWFNTERPLSLQALRGRVVVLHAFQMLCPGCVTHGIPQAAAVHAAFPPDEVAVIGLHSVFEHHEAMAPHALQAFIHEYRIAFPVAVDAAGTPGPVPQTMQAYGLRGTPSLMVLDHEGRIRLHQFGRMDDLRLGALIGELRAEAVRAAASCDADGCSLSSR
jgi:peroxiredoxin